MQRATASTPPNQRGGTQTPSTEPASKRRKIHETSAASSPSVSSTPGTPYAADPKYMQQTPTTLPEILRRGGTSTFTRGDGADTEWVLDLKMTPRQSKPVNGTNGNTNRPSGIPGLGEVESDQDEDEDEEDIWHNQPAGRQTYGSFKRKGQAGGKPKKTKDNNADEDDQDLSSASNSLSDSSDGGSDSDDNDPSTSSDEDNDKNTYARQRRLQQKQKKKQIDGSTGSRKSKKGTTTTVAEDSDEEMRRVRLAMEQKHDRMAGIGGGGGGGGGLHGTPRGGGGTIGRGGTKRPRRPDDHHGYNTNYKERPRSKKARKTI